MLAPRLKHYLDESHVKYRTIDHSVAYTAQQVAELAHIPGKKLAKPVMVKIDGKLAMIIEPASLKLNLKELEKLLDGKKVELARESEFKDKFEGCELGAMPPLGKPFGIETYLDDRLAGNENILFNGGTLRELVEMSFKDFETIAKAKKIHTH